MKRLLFALLLMTSLCSHAQEEVVYRYIIAEPQDEVFSEKCKLRIDDGIKPTKVKGEKEKYLTFNSTAAALMYLTSQGWELVQVYNKHVGSITINYWILRKPSTKEEVQEIIDKSLRKDE